MHSDLGLFFETFFLNPPVGGDGRWDAYVEYNADIELFSIIMLENREMTSQTEIGIFKNGKNIFCKQVQYFKLSVLKKRKTNSHTGQNFILEHLGVEA